MRSLPGASEQPARLPSTAPSRPLAGNALIAPVVPRQLSDRAVLGWEIVWSVLVLGALAYFWIDASPVREPLWTLVVFTTVAASSAFLVPISRIDDTLVIGSGPVMLILLVQSGGWQEAIAIWSTAYFFDLLVRKRRIGEAAEVVAYLIVCALVSIAAAAWLDSIGVSWPITVFAFTLVYLAARLVISMIRLAVVAGFSAGQTLREVMVQRLVAGALLVIIVSLIGLETIELIDRYHPTIDGFWGGAIMVFVIGIAMFGLGVYRESLDVTAQLSGMLDAALALPWNPDVPVEELAVSLAGQALPSYSISFVREAPRNVNEIIAELDDGYLVARRGAIQPPFLVRDQQVLDAVAHIAVSTAEVQRERERLQLAAATDELTGLPNYRGFREALELTSRQSQLGFAVVYLDIDHFKDVNDRYGHAAGNAVLQALATRLRTGLPQTDFVGRLGGDEFVLILTEAEDEAEGMRRSSELLTEVSSPVVLGHSVISLTLSSGLAFAEPGDANISALVDEADKRMYTKRGLDVLGDRSAAPVLRAGDAVIDLVAGVERAIRQRSLGVMYQPVVDCIEDRIIGFEALIRPDRNDLPGVSSEVIVHEARRLDLLTELSVHVIDVSVRDMKRFRELAPSLVGMSVNVDVEQVFDERFTAALLAAALDEECGVDLTLELGESSLRRTSEDLDRQLELLRSGWGIRIALDDFGRDSSTLLSVVQYPVDVLKVDRALVQGISLRKPQLVMQSLSLLTENLDVQMVVEGVEDADTCEQLVRTGVRYMQGFYFGEPLSADDMLRRLAEHGLKAKLG